MVAFEWDSSVVSVRPLPPKTFKLINLCPNPLDICKQSLPLTLLSSLLTLIENIVIFSSFSEKRKKLFHESNEKYITSENFQNCRKLNHKIYLFRKPWVQYNSGIPCILVQQVLVINGTIKGQYGTCTFGHVHLIVNIVYTVNKYKEVLCTYTVFNLQL